MTAVFFLSVVLLTYIRYAKPHLQVHLLQNQMTLRWTLLAKRKRTKCFQIGSHWRMEARGLWETAFRFPTHQRHVPSHPSRKGLYLSLHLQPLTSWDGEGKRKNPSRVGLIIKRSCLNACNVIHQLFWALFSNYSVFGTSLCNCDAVIENEFAGYNSLDKVECLSRKVRCYLSFNKINNELLLKLKDRTTKNL